jgi:hypothetical protein
MNAYFNHISMIFFPGIKNYQNMIKKCELHWINYNNETIWTVVILRQSECNCQKYPVLSVIVRLDDCASATQRDTHREREREKEREREREICAHSPVRVEARRLHSRSITYPFLWRRILDAFFDASPRTAWNGAGLLLDSCSYLLIPGQKFDIFPPPKSTFSPTGNSLARILY